MGEVRLLQDTMPLCWHPRRHLPVVQSLTARINNGSSLPEAEVVLRTQDFVLKLKSSRANQDT